IIARLADGVVAPHALAFGRWALALALMAPFVWRELFTRGLPWHQEWKQLLVLGATGMWICGAWVYLGGQGTTAANMALIYAATPVAIAVAGTKLLHERMSRAQGVAVVFALAGVVYIIAKGDPANLLALRFNPGDGWIVGAAVSWVAYSVLLRRWPSVLSPAARLAAIVAGGLVVLLPFTMAEALWSPLPPLGAKALGLMALAALLHPSTRAPASACLIAVLGYLAIDLVLLIGLVEHGAYALPLALPLAALTALRFGRAGAAAAAAVAIGIAVPHVLRQDPARVPRPEFARALGAWRVEHPGSTFVLGGYAEIDSMLVYGAPIWHHTILEPEFVVWLEPQRSAAFVRERLVARIRKAAANGGALVFSTEATALFTALPRNLEILSDPRGEFVVETVAAGAFGGIALHPPR
ncbi:MAG: DMT family transporter, partial [Planctomycetes bacterium]|nr:DMT family transporter [Planctomycetota bacterium]